MQNDSTRPCGRGTEMPAVGAILTRRSVRSFTPDPVSPEDADLLLRAAMQAPSAGNEQPWKFVVIDDRTLLARAAEINPYASFAASAPLGILVCGDLRCDRFGSAGKDGYWIQDVSAAMQNLLVAAHAIGLGAVWTGIHPLEDRVAAFRQLVGAPEHIIPLGLAVIGHPASMPEKPGERFNAGLVFRNRWGGA